MVLPAPLCGPRVAFDGQALMAIEHPVRFGAFVREITVGQRYLSANALAPSIDSDADRRAHRDAKLSLRSLDVYRLLQPYVSARFRDQARAVIPLALYLVGFQLLILRQGVVDSWTITGGLAAVIIGLMLFMEGLKVGLMPFGEAIGNILPSKAALPVVLLVTFLLGIGVTFGVGYGLNSPRNPISPNARVCYWGGWGGSLVVNDVDAGFTLAYVMNRMGEGTVGDDRAHTLLRALYASLENG